MFELGYNQQMQDSLLKDLQAVKRRLRMLSWEQIARNSGAQYIEHGLQLDIFFAPYRIAPESLQVTDAQGNLQSNLFQSIVLTYLCMANGTLFADHWISFRELPHGDRYCHAFQGYAPDRLPKKWGSNIQAFRRACAKTGGDPIDIGDAGYSFLVFPKLKIAVVYWLGEEGVAPESASLLFDASAVHYMVTAGLAIIGSKLVDLLIEQNE